MALAHQLHHVVLPHQAALGVGLEREATARHRALDLLHLVLVLALPLHLVQLVGERLEFGERELEGESVVVVAGRVLQQVLKGFRGKRFANDGCLFVEMTASDKS